MTQEITMRARTLLLSSLIALAGTAMAGTVNVSFVNPDSYTDAGNSKWDEAPNLQALAHYLQTLGQQDLPANQTLNVEVLDVDLAGTVKLRGNGEVRIVRGKADFPRLHLRYTLLADGKPVRNGDEWLSDLNYTQHLSTYRKNEPLYYEKYVLFTWFKSRFVEQQAAATR
jgi:hypothetical protein